MLDSGQYFLTGTATLIKMWCSKCGHEENYEVKGGGQGVVLNNAYFETHLEEFLDPGVLFVLLVVVELPCF